MAELQNILTPEELEEKKKTKWSYSRLSCYKQCHFQYKLKYVDKHYPKFGNVATEFGTAIHAAEESIANYIKEGKPINYNAVKNQFIIDCAKIDYKYEDWFVPNKDSLKTYEEQKYYYLTTGIYRLEQFINEHPDFEIIGAEIKIDYLYKNDETKRFTGFIDRLVHDKKNDIYYIQDIKSWPLTTSYPEEQKTPVQLVIYSLALADKLGIDPRKIKCQYDLPLPNALVNAGIDDYISNAKDIIDKAFSGIDAKNWKPTATALCAWCPFSATNPDAEKDFKFLCPYHSIWDRDLRLPKTASAPFIQWKGIEDYPHALQLAEGLLKAQAIKNMKGSD